MWGDCKIEWISQLDQIKKMSHNKKGTILMNKQVEFDEIYFHNMIFIMYLKNVI